ncbi:MAG: hypothetical protein A3G49_04760 [Candidatus Sungbacteria bacterium RIFCSPLOWO2_12_FULL_41_11]|uniref:Uncharacterized protein n=1 Tax=Candidatus Sungbacteria bacterium RIFCSPLOWO2_12_FULL_41_11 TaxID=1802286 RepID=A0A1G2LN33_9BACT|nr:MAG: hypothetical protein UV01_C0004G0013 [Parcubacteria group bacterium GW2011_GWA2_42_14]OGZ99622.1 MAG: hypothetical protein A3D41_05730 [Candidatus Sungbacteria bacterium RIFCSPHIGHO2_02_FULL_41_12b]OHA13020.1 MAG: hypothetical protein A3G49_04760 [Candidatus Sungbacteria bacterium RIFCSPLOWO2_12_FULL_41_11]
MKQAGERVMLVTFRPGERMYGGWHKIIFRESKLMKLELEQQHSVSEMHTTIEVTDRGELDDDSLCGPAAVRVTESFKDSHRGNTIKEEHYSAYYYELGEYIFLVLI